MAVVIAIDESKNAAAIIIANYEDLPKLKKEFSRIKHFREVKRNRESYLKNEFKPKLEKAIRKYYLKPRYYAKINHYFWEDVEYYVHFGLEIIVDDKLWQAVVDRFGDMQISIIKRRYQSSYRKVKTKTMESSKRKKCYKTDEN